MPIWFNLISAALPMPSAIAWAMIAGLVQKLSSPVNWMRPPSSAVSCFQPVMSASPRPSSMFQSQILSSVMLAILFTPADQLSSDSLSMVFPKDSHHMDFTGKGIVILQCHKTDDRTTQTSGAEIHVLDIFNIVNER